ncbi:MAG: septum formation initiator family protein [Gemmatimonadota bacterium]
MAGGGANGARERMGRWGRRSAWLLAGLVVLYYAILGGGYSIFDVRELERGRAAAEARVDSLQSVLDSLTAWADSLVADPLAIERLARERYGFIRDGETLYRFVPEGEEHGARDGVDRDEEGR